MNPWKLPFSAWMAGKEYEIDPDYRNILLIFSYFQDPELPDFCKWQICLGLFYKEEIPQERQADAMEWFSDFITMGRPQPPGPRLLDWEQDAPLILADINGITGREIRGCGFIHWWTFLSWFHSIGQGQLLPVVQIRKKLALRKPLNEEESAFYRYNRDLIDLKPRYTAREQVQRDRLNALLEDKRQVKYGKPS